MFSERESLSHTHNSLVGTDFLTSMLWDPISAFQAETAGWLPPLLCIYMDSVDQNPSHLICKVSISIIEPFLQPGFLTIYSHITPVETLNVFVGTILK